MYDKIPRPLLTLFKSVLLMKVYVIKVRLFLGFFFKFKKKCIAFPDGKKTQKTKNCSYRNGPCKLRGKGKLTSCVIQINIFREFNSINLTLLTHPLAEKHEFLLIY